MNKKFVFTEEESQAIINIVRYQGDYDTCLPEIAKYDKQTLKKIHDFTGFLMQKLEKSLAKRSDKIIKELDWEDVPEPTEEDIEMDAMINEFEESVNNG